MRILVVGSGGREHALVWKIAQSPHVTRLLCAPGNAGIGQERLARGGAPVECVNIGAEDLAKLAALAQGERIGLTVVGPDNPLALGITDLFQARGLRIWGPSRSASRFESSKVFAQRFVQTYGIPAPLAQAFDEPQAAKRFAATLGRSVIKADGLALGKGVLICATPEEAERAVDQIMVSRVFGEAGARIIVQEFLEGVELSLHALCDGHVARMFPTSQDHKRALDADQGLNTGGMGAYCPTPFLSEKQLVETGRVILEPFLRGCAAEGIDYRGIIYPGIMLTAAGPRVLEFNARFGDPETQVYLARLKNDLVELLEASADGRLDTVQLEWSPLASVCVVIASGGYPGPYVRGKLISGLDSAAAVPGVKVFHAGTAWAEGTMITNGGRVLGVTALGKDLNAARIAAYAAVEKIHFDGAHYRRDIGARALSA